MLSCRQCSCLALHGDRIEYTAHQLAGMIKQKPADVGAWLACPDAVAPQHGDRKECRHCPLASSQVPVVQLPMAQWHVQVGCLSNVQWVEPQLACCRCGRLAQHCHEEAVRIV